MTDTEVLQWIKKNLSGFITEALAGTSIYTEELMAGLTCRETGELIAKYAPHYQDVYAVSKLMRGDWGKRPGETIRQYHGFGFPQIDIGSFPEFIKSLDWQDPLKVYKKAMEVLQGKRNYIKSHFPVLDGVSLTHYLTAAYNCGEGNEAKVLFQHLDPDAYTTGHNYSKSVFEFAEIYKNI